jgi:hypothetical protein
LRRKRCKHVYGERIEQFHLPSMRVGP